MKLSLKLVLCCMLLALMPLAPVLAEDAGVGLSMRAICYTYDIMTGNIGLLAGLCISAFGLYTIIKGSMGWGIALILGGAAFTALPKMVISGLSAIQGIVGQSGMSGNSQQGNVTTNFGKAIIYSGHCESIPVDMTKYQNNGTSLAQGPAANGSGVGAFQSGNGAATSPGDRGFVSSADFAKEQNCATTTADCAIWENANNPGNINACVRSDGSICALPGQLLDANNQPVTFRGGDGRLYAVYPDMTTGFGGVVTQFDKYANGTSSAVSGPTTNLSVMQQIYSPCYENDCAGSERAVNAYMASKGYGGITDYTQLDANGKIVFAQAVTKKEGAGRLLK